MAIRLYKFYTPGTRHYIRSNFHTLSTVKSERSLIKINKKKGGRNNQGVITIRHRGGGHKQKYRIIDFKRNNYNVKGKVISIIYDPNRNARIALVSYKNGAKRYIIHPNELAVGSTIQSGENIPLKIGNALPLKNIPIAAEIHNIEINSHQGGKMARSAGVSAFVIAKVGKYVTIKLPSNEIRLIQKECYATVGRVGNIYNYSTIMGKAGRNRWLGYRPRVRGIAMNACDHPHGGGEGRSPIGRSKPYTPWGKPALGVLTRQRNKYSDVFIIRRKK
jgi:large subunit ribosomal protein L2